MAVGAAGAEAALTVEERLARGPFFRGDTRTLVGSLLLAVAFSANMQITERIDQIWTGGLGVPLGHTFAEVWWPTAAIYFGGTGGLIVLLPEHDLPADRGVPVPRVVPAQQRHRPADVLPVRLHRRPGHQHRPA